MEAQPSSDARLSTSGASAAASGEDANTFKILITTDNHLGFMERDPKRGEDSFTSFEEILRAARVEHQVDIMLLGGDLFHENKPSLGCLNRTCALFRKYLWGSRPVAVSLRSDPAESFPTHSLPVANWQDPNLNIAVPVFAIHGNHDDPVGGTSSLDVLANNGHLNYYGLVSSLEDIQVRPVLLQKGATYIALYGLGNIRDDRLHRCFLLKKVHFIAPKAQEGIRWFNILVLHQNRGARDARGKSGITEAMLAGFGMHLVIWGNEHEQRMVPEATPHRFDIVQPGSSILTSITPQECNPKQYGILEVRGLSYRLTPFPLRSVRPIVRRSIEMVTDQPRARTLDAVEEYLKTIVEEMIDEAEEQLQRIPDDVLQFHPNIRFPLMRLTVDFTDPQSAPFPQPNLVRFGQQYMDIVANPGDLLKEIRPSDKRSAASRAVAFLRGTLGAKDAAAVAAAGAGPQGGDAFLYAGDLPQFRSVDIVTKVAEVFRSGVRPPCQILSEMELSAAVHAFAEKNERDAIEDKINEMLHTTQKMIWKRLGDSDDILDPSIVSAEVRRCKIEREKKLFREIGGSVTEDETAADEEKRGEGRRRADPASDGGDDDDTDNERDDEDRVEAARFARLSQMFDGVHSNSGGAAGEDEAQPQYPPNRRRRDGSASGGDAGDDVPAFLRDHARALLEQERRDLQQLQGGRVKTEQAGTAADEEGGYDTLLGVDLEELPEDGLNHITLDDLVSREAHNGDVGSDAPRKRTRVASRPVEEEAFDVDGDDDDGGVVSVGGRRPPTAASAATTRRRTERQPRKRAAAAAAAVGSVAPALNLVPHNSVKQGPGGAGGARPTASGRQGSSKGSAGGATLELLSKWGASQN